MSWRKWKIGLLAALVSTGVDGLIVSLADPELVSHFKQRILPMTIGLIVILAKAFGMFIKDHPIDQITDDTQTFTKEDMKKTITLLILSGALTALIVGCASTPNADGTTTPAFNLNTQTGGIVAEIAAKDGTTIALQQHPEWREQFQDALTQLNILANADKVDVAAVAAIVQSLPVKQLEGKTAKLIIGDVQIVTQSLTSGGVILSQEQYADAKIIIGAIRDGVKMGLDATAQ